ISESVTRTPRQRRAARVTGRGFAHASASASLSIVGTVIARRRAPAQEPADLVFPARIVADLGVGNSHAVLARDLRKVGVVAIRRRDPVAARELEPVLAGDLGLDGRYRDRRSGNGEPKGGKGDRKGFRHG